MHLVCFWFCFLFFAEEETEVQTESVRVRTEMGVEISTPQPARERMPEPLTPRELPPWAAHQGSVTLGKSLALSEPSLRPKSRMRTKNLPPPLGPGPASDDPCFPSPVVVGSPRQLPRAHPGIAPTCPGRDRALRPAAAALT